MPGALLQHFRTRRAPGMFTVQCQSLLRTGQYRKILCASCRPAGFKCSNKCGEATRQGSKSASFEVWQLQHQMKLKWAWDQNGTAEECRNISWTHKILVSVVTWQKLTNTYYWGSKLMVYHLLWHPKISCEPVSLLDYFRFYCQINLYFIYLFVSLELDT